MIENPAPLRVFAVIGPSVVTSTMPGFMPAFMAWTTDGSPLISLNELVVGAADDAARRRVVRDDLPEETLPIRAGSHEHEQVRAQGLAWIGGATWALVMVTVVPTSVTV
jgi:hypothetical protein